MIREKVTKVLLAPSHVARMQKLLIHDCHSGSRIRVLDVGGGTGRVWKELLTCQCIELTIVDPWVPEGLHEDRANRRICSTLAEASHRLEDQEFDYVFAIDVLEHLPRSEGYSFLYDLVRLSRKVAFVYTPNGFVWQPPSRNNRFNAHLSGWSVRDLKEAGFTEIRGHTGLRTMYGSYAIPKIQRWTVLSVAANLVGNLIVRLFPSKAFALSGILCSEKLAYLAYQD